MECFRKFIADVSEAAEEMLYRELLFLADVECIRSAGLVLLFDDMNSSAIGFPAWVFPSYSRRSSRQSVCLERVD